MGHLFPSKVVLSCYFQCKPLWQRVRIPRRCWDLFSCWCSAGVLGLWSMLQASFKQSLCMVMLFCSSCSLNSLASPCISKNTCPLFFAGAAARLPQWAAPSSADNEPRALTLHWNPRNWNTNLSSFWNNTAHFWETWYWICGFLALTQYGCCYIPCIRFLCLWCVLRGRETRESRTYTFGSFYI